MSGKEVDEGIVFVDEEHFVVATIGEEMDSIRDTHRRWDTVVVMRFGERDIADMKVAE